MRNSHQIDPGRVNWGVRGDIANLHPSVLRHFARSDTCSGFGKELANARGKLLEAGSWSAALHPPLKAEPEDIWIHKHSISGFVGTELEATLQVCMVFVLALLLDEQLIFLTGQYIFS